MRMRLTPARDIFLSLQKWFRMGFGGKDWGTTGNRTNLLDIELGRHVAHRTRKGCECDSQPARIMRLRATLFR